MKIEKKLLEIPFDCIKNLIIEPCLKFNSEGLFIRGYTESNAAMVMFELPKSKFIEYEFEKEQRFKIDIELLFKIMKRIKTKFISLNFKDEKLIISDENKKEYSITVMYDDDEERDTPELELMSNFKMKSSELQNLFLDVGVISDNMKIETKEGRIIISAKDLNEFNYEFEYESKGEGCANYSIEYLSKFLCASKYFDEVFFEFGNDSPCKLTFENDLKIQFILAPRIE